VEDWAQWEKVLGVLAAIGGAVVGVKFLFHFLKCWCKRIRDNMFGIGDLKKDIAALAEQVTFVVSEFRPNNGTSMKDTMNRIETRQLLGEQTQWAILDDMKVGVYTTDGNGEFLRVNRKYLRMTGRTPAEVRGSGWVNTVATRDRDRVEHDWAQAIAEEREFESEFLLITPDNNRLEVTTRTYRMDGPDGAPLGFFGVLTPIDEHVES